MTTMQTSVPTTLTLASVSMSINPQDVFMQVSSPFPDMASIAATFQSPTSEAVPVSRRLGFEESSPQAMGALSSSLFLLGGSPFVPLFSPLALAHPIQPSFVGPFRISPLHSLLV